VGSGANGKTTLAEIISSLHRQVVSLQLAGLSGFRLSPLLNSSLVVVDETPQRIDEQALKSLVSGGLCQIDRKYRDPISFHPTAKWIILGNAVPAISDQSHGFWRRMPVVPFTRQFDPDEQDPALVQKITRMEMSGVLNWAVTGLVRLVRRGQFPEQSEAMVTAQGEGQKESNSVLAWWRDDRAEIDPDVETPRQAVYGDYKIWCNENGMSPLGVERFWNRLKAIAGQKTVEATARKIQGQTMRVVPLRLSSDPTKSSQKVVNGRW
jgi:putative DNA primase/helicase